ncbi:MAG: cell envelope integrity protein TolA [Candidatus Thiodiazotropha sp.]
MSRQQNRRKPMSEINVVPYIDVMLVLLVIFMITAPLLTQGVDVELPQADAEPLSQKNEEPVVVTVDSKGDFYIDVGEGRDRPVSAEDMVDRVRAVLKYKPKTPILMLSILKRSPVAVTLAVLLHILIVLFLIFGMEWELFPKKAEPKVNVVQAHAVDAEQLRQKEAEEKAKERKQKEQEAKKRKQAEAQKRKIAEEKQRKADLEAKRKAEVKRKADAEAKRKAEAEAKRKAAVAAKQKAEAERKAQAEAKRKAELAAKQKAEAEAKRKAAAAEAKRKAEAAAQAERERALQEQLAAEQNAREIDRYVAVIKQQIERSWLKPGQTTDQLSCVVQVRLIPGGDVVPGGVSIVKSSGNGAFDRSVEAAVYKAAPLPVPSGALFESFRNLRLNFKPNK